MGLPLYSSRWKHPDKGGCAMNGKSRRVLWATLIVMLVLFSGFAVFAGTASAQTATRDIEADTLYIAMQNDMPNLNYFDPATNTVWKSYVVGWMYDTMGGYTPDFTIYQSMAESWEADASGLNVTVYLRQGITFHDGQPVTATDVVFTYQVLYWNQLFKSNLEALYWDTPDWSRWDGNGVSHIGVEAVDDYTVVFHLSRPDPLFYYVTINMPIIPEHIWSNHLVTPSGAPGDSDDMTIDTTWSDETNYQTTIGCGPWKFVKWVRNQYAIIEPYDGYYGKNLTISWQGKEWPMFPQNIKRIVFKIYSNLDTATLALKSGEVHYIAWSITPSYYNTLKTDPNIGFEFSDDQGFFYLAFNMRKAPMNDLNFRVAVSHCIDKDFIVSTLLGGYGSKGTVPISITNPRYVNTSAIPPEFDLDKAKQVLDSAGYTDQDGDGWRDAPDGTPIKLSILTPPKDYDPVRADAGVMISSNLKSIGLNIDSIPTSFDTIVSKVFVQVDYQMYILGWAVGSFPETYLYDFFHSSQAAPAGYNAPGYSNPKVDELLEKIAVEMDDEKRIQMIKDVEGILVHDLPYNVLFYRKNIEAYYQAKWVGWISAYGSIFNGFSLNSLRHPGAVTPGGGGGTTSNVGATGGTIQVIDNTTYYVYPDGNMTPVDYVNYDGLVLGIYGPDHVLSGENARFIITATDDYGKPYASLDLNVSVQVGNDVTYYNITTGDDGMAYLDITVPYARYDKVTITASGTVQVAKPDASQPGYYILINYTATKGKDVPITFVKRVIKMKAWADDAILNPAGQTTVHVQVTDQDGAPVSGVGVGVYTETLYGSVDNAYKVTDANGMVTFTYTAPTADLITNRHLAEQFKLYLNETGIVNKTVATETHKMTLIIGVVNNNPSEWYQVDIISVDNWVIAAGDTANIVVRVTDINGNPVADEPVNVMVGHSELTDSANWVATFFEDTTNVSWPTSVTTGADGTATITLQANTNANIAEIVEVSLSRSYSTKDSVSIYVGNTTGVASLGSYVGMYAVNVSYSVDPMSSTYNQLVNITIEVYDNGIPAPNVQGWVWVRFTDFGLPFSEDDMDLYFWWSGGFMYFVTDGNGRAQVSATTVPLISDVAATCAVWVDTFGWGFPDSIWEGLVFGSEYPVGAGAVDSFVLTRAKSPIVVSEYSFDVDALTYNTPVATMEMTVVDSDGPVVGASVDVDYSMGAFSSSESLTTNDTGVATVDITPPAASGDTAVPISVMLSSSDSAMDQVFDYVLPYITVTDDELNKLYVEVVSISNGYVDANSTTSVTVKVLDYYGTPVPNAVVYITTSTGTVNATTDSNGEATITVRAPDALYTGVLPVSIAAYNESREGRADMILIVKGTNGSVVDQLAATLATLKETQDNLDETQQELSATQTELTMTEQELNATQTQLAQTTLDLASATLMGMIYLALMLIFLITTIVFAVLWLKKKPGAPEMPEEAVTEEEMPTEEETGYEEETYEETPEEEMTEMEEETSSEEEVE